MLVIEPEELLNGVTCDVEAIAYQLLGGEVVEGDRHLEVPDLV